MLCELDSGVEMQERKKASGFTLRVAEFFVCVCKCLLCCFGVGERGAFWAAQTSSRCV